MDFFYCYFTFFLWSVGATLACGTGACAVVVAAVLEGHAERVSKYSALLFSWVTKFCQSVIKISDYSGLSIGISLLRFYVGTILMFPV